MNLVGKRGKKNLMETYKLGIWSSQNVFDLLTDERFLNCVKSNTIVMPVSAPVKGLHRWNRRIPICNNLYINIFKHSYKYYIKLHI